MLPRFSLTPACSSHQTSTAKLWGTAFVWHRASCHSMQVSPRHGVVAVVLRAGHRNGTGTAGAGTRMAFPSATGTAFTLSEHSWNYSLYLLPTFQFFKYIFQITLAEVGLERGIISSLFSVCGTKTADSVRAAFAGKCNSNKCFRTTYFTDRLLQFFSLLNVKINCLQQVTLLLHSPLTWTTGN